MFQLSFQTNEQDSVQSKQYTKKNIQNTINNQRLEPKYTQFTWHETTESDHISANYPYLLTRRKQCASTTTGDAQIRPQQLTPCWTLRAISTTKAQTPY